MEALGPAQPAPTQEELIELLREDIQKVMSAEGADETDTDRVWILRRIHKNYTYYRNLQYCAPGYYQGLVDFSQSGGVDLPESASAGMYDYSQNWYLGFCRKLEAVLGTRMPNAIAVPDNAADEDDIRAAKAANDAAEYIRQKCDLQSLILFLVFGLFNFGTMFWRMEFVFDGDKYGWQEDPVFEQQEQQLGGSGYDCPTCGEAHPTDDSNARPDTCAVCQGPMQGAQFRSSQAAQVPFDTGKINRTAKGALEITLHDGSEVSVPLDSRTVTDCLWIRREFEQHKAFALKKYGDIAREAMKVNPGDSTDVSMSSQYGQAIRSAMASPIGIVRSKRENQWTVTEDYWPSAMYELFEKDKREMLAQNFPKGVQITSLRGRIVALKEKQPPAHWQECKPEPSMRIMGEPLGDDWTTVQDIQDNTLNQCQEIIERSNDPGFADPTRLDFDAWQRRRDTPASLFPALPRAGQSLSDIIYRPEPVHFSEQIPSYRQGVMEGGKDIAGLTDAVTGAGTSTDPTARQTELKTNAAIRQLGVIWVMIGKSLEQVYLKSCRLLAEFEDGVLAFSKKDQFGGYAQVAVVTDDLRNGRFHFEADEAIPMTWGQQRDLLMFMLDKPNELLNSWGFNDPLNVPELKRLLGMPGMRTPLEDDRTKGMEIIGRLLKDKAVPGAPGPDGQPGPKQSSIQPAWEDNHQFLGQLVRAYLTMNHTLAQQNPDGYENVQLYGQAQESAANQPAPPAPPKTSLAVSLKGEDLGDPAVQAALDKAGVLPDGVQVQGELTRMQQMQPPVNGMPPPAGPPPQQ